MRYLNRQLKRIVEDAAVVPPEGYSFFATTYFIGNMLDSITKFEVDRQRKLVRLTVANRITREAKLYGDQGCIIHQPGRDSVFFKPVRVATTLPNAASTPWPMGDVLPNTPLPAEIDTIKLRSAVDAAFANPNGFTAALTRFMPSSDPSPSS